MFRRRLSRQRPALASSLVLLAAVPGPRPDQTNHNLSLAFFGLTEGEAEYRSGKNEKVSETVYKARCAAWFVLRHDMRLTFEKIGAMFGAHHTSVSYGLAKAETAPVEYIRRALAERGYAPASSPDIRPHTIRLRPTAHASSASVDVHTTFGDGDSTARRVQVALPSVLRPQARKSEWRRTPESCDGSTTGTGLYRFTGLLTRRDLIGALKEAGAAK